MVDEIGSMMGNAAAVKSSKPVRLPGPNFDDLHPEAKLEKIVGAINTERSISWRAARWLLEQGARCEAEVIRLSKPEPEMVPALARPQREVVEHIAGEHNARHGTPNKNG